MSRISLLILTISGISTLGSEVPPSAAILTTFMDIGDVTNQKIAQFVGKKAIPLIPPFPDSGRTHAVLEQESLVSKYDTAYSTLQKKVADLYHPKPIVDTIQPHEKYGNDGGDLRVASVAVIGAFEGLSNVLNAAVNVPFETVRQVSRKLGKTASPVGALFVGR